MDWGSPPPIGERGGQVQMRARNPAVVLSAARDIAVVLRNELHGARRSDSREGGNRTRVHVNEFNDLRPRQVPQRCLTDFRLCELRFALRKRSGASPTPADEQQLTKLCA